MTGRTGPHLFIRYDGLCLDDVMLLLLGNNELEIVNLPGRW